MKAILKDLNIPLYMDEMLVHPIKMLFVDSHESGDVYHFVTTVEKQFCTKEEISSENGLSKKQIEEKLYYAQSLIGRTFEINLFKFTVKELTHDKYVAFKFSYNKTITDYCIASYMTKDDVMLKLKYSITMQGFQGEIEGVKSNGQTEEIIKELFFPKRKHYDIPYSKYANIDENYIVNEVAINPNRSLELTHSMGSQGRPWLPIYL